MTFDQWFDEYGPIENKNGDSGLVIDDKCYMFETFEPDISVVLEANESNPATVWTVVEGDGGECYLGDGYHYVNRIGYIVTMKAYGGDGFSIPFGE